MSIGALSRATSVKVTTIRFYEGIGLLPEPPRTGSNRRTYDDCDVRRLRFIRHARDLGFEVEAIRQLLALGDQPDRPCADADKLARLHLREIDSKIARLIGLKREITAMLDCAGHGAVRECRVLEVLADHEECIHDAH